MKRVHRYPYRILGESFGDVQRLAQGNDHRPVGAEHGMQRFNRQTHPRLLRCRNHRRDPLLHLPPGRLQTSPLDAAAHQHYHLAPYRRRFFNYPLVVLYRPAPISGGVGGEKPSPAVGGHPQASLPHHASRRLRPARGPHLLPPQADPSDAGPHAPGRRFLHAPVFGGFLVEAEPPLPPRPGHQLTPAQASTGRMRRAAASGSDRTPAASANRTNSAR